jgi:hypothetical protein
VTGYGTGARGADYSLLFLYNNINMLAIFDHLAGSLQVVEINS